MVEPTCINVICPACELAWLLPLNGRTYICPACEYVGLERDLKEKDFYALHPQSRKADTQ